ncbi:iron complex outermembrane recepter protein [Sphingobium faniae]|nr:iron complex outermembrane recepter protein [Sphingobium faniae]
MSLKKHLMLSISAIAAASVSPAFAQQAPEAEQAPQSSQPQLEDIIVTAQRTSQRLQEVPIAVSAVTAAGLESRGITSAFSLGNAVPGLQVTQTGTTTTPYLRGVGSNAANPNNEASVATYIDGFYIAAPYANALSFNNIDRIEVLKGPQGTLFGRNATGGVIQIVTRTPQHDPAMNFSLGYANYDTVSAAAYVTGGLTNTIAADVAVQYKNQGNGFGRDLTRGVDTYLGWEGSVRSKILWEPAEGTKVTIAGNYAEMKNDFLNYVFAPGSVGPDGVTTYEGRYNTSTDFQAESRTKTYGGSLTINQDVGFATLVSLTSRQIAKGLNQFDRDTTPLPLLSFFSPQRVKTFTQELQLNSNPGGPLQWTLGGFYFNNNAGYVPARLIGLAFGAPDAENDIQGVQKTKSVSVYGQATYEIVPRVNLTGGLRYTHEKIDVDWAAGAGTTSAPIIVAPVASADTKFNKMTWRAALDYEFVDNIHSYISYNRGIKSGGFDLLNPGGAPYRPEILDAFEAGLKSELFDRRLRLNISGFVYKYKDIQVAANPNGVIVTANGPRATIKGVDADFELAVTSGLRLSGGLGYTHGKFDRFPDAVVYGPDGSQVFDPDGSALDVTGNQTSRTPKFTANLGAIYTIETSAGKFGLSGSYYHNSGFYWDVDNRLRAPKYDLFGASISWTDTSGVFGVRLWGENLTDEAYHTQGVSGGSIGDTVVYGAPRTYGVTLTGRF